MQRCCSSVLPRLAAPAKAAAPISATPARKSIHDIAITRTGKPIIRVPGGGRSSLGGHTVTVFGASGFLGRYIVNRLARVGCNVIVPYREEMAKRHLKVSGDLGRVNFIEFDLRNTQSIEESVRHSDIVFNLIGRDYPTKNFSFEDVHIEGTQRIVESVAKYDVDRYIHISSYNADPRSPSEFFSTKGQGEVEARAIFPETTIVRPAPMYGFEDRLLHSLASGRDFLSANGRKQKFWPVHVIDVGRALEAIAYDDHTAGQTFELYGPREYSKEQIAHLIAKMILKEWPHINLPKAIAKPLAGALNKLWWPTYCADDIEREFIDQAIDRTAKTFADLNLTPVELDEVAFHYLRDYRSNRYYDLPPMTEREKREERKYMHVIEDM
ncbi:putative NADH-ubiquinone oxidoreductase 39 kDa subunit [Sphaerosporella brunnea]|uniref:Putative NADH-ubiquinone oxidoreductase 39 kDa subunit n=1 Tax=Sphaerosporella brunnea TaxID=1250544 RepID=A0A5J5F9J7_9PEZI|nr:putative NADH-ubiquinone oxidoreductase 39 kDa subunit [Sphaerosporella brunnea]